MRLLLLAFIATTLVLVSCGVGRGESSPIPPPTPEASTPAPTPASTPDSAAPVEEEITPPRGPFVGSLKTNFKKHSVPLEEIVSGGPPPDGIPPIDHPRFEPVAEVLGLEPLEPVVSFNSFWFAWAVFRPDTVVYQP